MKKGQADKTIVHSLLHHELLKTSHAKLKWGCKTKQKIRRGRRMRKGKEDKEGGWGRRMRKEDGEGG